MMTDYNRQTVLQKPSRFITECPPALFEIWNLEEEAVADDADGDRARWWDRVHQLKHCGSLARSNNFFPAGATK